MKHTIFVMLLMLAGIVLAHSGDSIDVRFGKTPAIDGSFSSGEWNDANSITYNNYYGTVTVYFKHNSHSLLVAFDIPDSSFPDFDDSGIALDINHDGIASDTDYFLELSRSGRYDTRTGTDYSNHDMSSPDGWEAMYTTNTNGWQVEYNISFELIDITSKVSKTIGIAFHTLDGSNGEYDWPTSCHILHPNTFADALSSDNWGSVGVAEELNSKSENTSFLFSPNPLNSEITIHYKLPAPSYITLKVYNFTGQLVRTIVDESRETGYHKAVWDGRDSKGERVPSGVYFLRLTTGDFSVVRKITVLK